MSREVEADIGYAKVKRRSGKYEIEIGNQRLILNGREELAYLRTIVDQMMQIEHEEMLEERRRQGIKTYVEYRGGQVVSEY